MRQPQEISREPSSEPLDKAVLRDGRPPKCRAVSRPTRSPSLLHRSLPPPDGGGALEGVLRYPLPCSGERCPLANANIAQRDDEPRVLSQNTDLAKPSQSSDGRSKGLRGEPRGPDPTRLPAPTRNRR